MTLHAKEAQLLDWILVKAQESASLTAWEEDFISDLTERREKYGVWLNLSERQWEILERIAEKD